MTRTTHSLAHRKTIPRNGSNSTAAGSAAAGATVRQFVARTVTVDAAGAIGTTGRRAWFLPGKFRFCPACGHQPPGQAREINKLASLSAEGRSSATTLLVSSALRWMNAHGRQLPADKRKLLGFTDNRQDAALAGRPFQRLPVRRRCCAAATLAAVARRARTGSREDEFGRRVQEALGFTAANRERRAGVDARPRDARVSASQRRAHAGPRAGATASGPTSGAAGASPTRTWRSWAWSRADYVSLDELGADDAAFAARPELQLAS